MRWPSRPRTQRFEGHVRVDRCGDGGEDVVVPVAGDVASDLWEAPLVERPLCAELGNELFFIEEEELREQPQRAHGNVVLAASLDPADRGEHVLKGCPNRHGGALDQENKRTSIEKHTLATNMPQRSDSAAICPCKP